MNSILIFPSSTTSSVDFLDRSRSLGITVYGASSLKIDPNAQLFDDWAWLPQITDTGFENQFLALLSTYKISRIFCPIPVAHKCIENIFAAHKVDCILLPAPLDSELLRYQKLDARAQKAFETVNVIVDGGTRLSSTQVKSIFSYTDNVWGQCGELKLGALIAALSNAPKGDVVEIGAFLGKSAAALTLLANWLEIGNVLVIDPWTTASAVQKDAPEYVQQLSVGSYWGAIAGQFMVNLTAVAHGNFNYIRSTSFSSLTEYTAGAVCSEEFGTTTYCGAIAVLHIDGNHDYEAVLLDAELWVPLVVPEGWVIFDDYSWAHGDGPRRVGNQILNQYSENIRSSFVCDGALFIKFNAAVK